MKRFITYLYEYEKGQKGKNTGFIRVDERNGRVVFQISVRNFISSQESGEIYAYVWENGLQGIEIGKAIPSNGQLDVRIELDANHMMDTNFSLDRVVGVGLMFPNLSYIASCWKDAYADVIGTGKFHVWEPEMTAYESAPENADKMQEMKVLANENMDEMQEMKVPAFESKVEGGALNREEVGNMEWEDETVENYEELVSSEKTESSEKPYLSKTLTYELVTYQKMELNAIKSLPSPNWYLCNNRFLVHGFFNYGYLILKKTTEADGEKAYLGVPGIYEKPEMVMATLFGFPEFQTLPKEVSSSKMEEIIRVPRSKDENWPSTGEPKAGSFGCWLIPIRD